MEAINLIPKHYLFFFKKMNAQTKIALINWLSSSLLEETKEEKDHDLFDCFGTFISDETAEEEINSIRKARYFKDKNIEL